MKAILLEDERLNYQELCNLLTEINPDIKLSPQLPSIAEARRFLRSENDYDLIFADIRLADGLVFEALSDAPKEVPVIFTTAYDEYTLRAFDYNAIAYLLKPLRREDVKRAVAKSKQQPATPDLLRLIQNAIAAQAPVYRQRFLVAHADYSEVVATNDISHITTDNGIVRLHLTEGRAVTISFSLDELEKQLDPQFFFRANRQTIVHIAHVKRLHNWFKGKTQLQVDCYPDVRIEVSKERTARLKDFLNR